MDVEKTIEFLLTNQAKHDERLGRIEAAVDSLAGSVGELTGKVGNLDGVMATLAESQIKVFQGMDLLTARLSTIAQESVERDRQLGQRIESLVSAIGEFVRNRPANG
jgi:hypothetical protein